MSIKVRIYKGDKAAETYLFVAASEDLEHVPDVLLKKLGDLLEVMNFTLNANKQLVRVTGDVVIAAINAQGYYLQLPPAPKINSRREKMHERFTR